MSVSKNQKRRGKKLKSVGYDGSCSVCGMSDCPEILTLHHLFPKRLGRQPSLKRKYRYMIVCPNCHAKIEKGIIKASDKEVE